MSFINDELLEKWWQVLVECVSDEERIPLMKRMKLLE